LIRPFSVLGRPFDTIDRADSHQPPPGLQQFATFRGADMRMPDRQGRTSEPDMPDAAGAGPATAPAPAATTPERAGRVHLVVVTTWEGRTGDSAVLLTRFWHPGERRWKENAFESLEHALHLFTEESGWILQQQQALDAPKACELIFEARREDFSRPSTEAILEDIGLTRQDVARLMERVDRESDGP
jgi:hypothetical protein